MQPGNGMLISNMKQVSCGEKQLHHHDCSVVVEVVRSLIYETTHYATDKIGL